MYSYLSSQPSIRGILTSCAGVAATLGFFIVYLLGSVLDWRTVALCCLSVPLTTIVAISFVPETPLWLLSKDRKTEALKSLQWLRGWVPSHIVEKEFGEMQRYSENANSCIICSKADIKCTHPAPTTKERLKELLRKRTIKPFLLVIVLFVFAQFGGLAAMRPYMVQILKAYGTPIDANWGTVSFEYLSIWKIINIKLILQVIMGLMGLIANIVSMCIVKVVGKRKLTLFSLFGTSLCCISIGNTHLL